MTQTMNAQARTHKALQIAPLQGEHLESGASLFAARYETMRQLEPLLPADHGGPEHVLPRLRDLVNKHPGVVAMRGTQIVGFMAGQVLPDWRGKRSMYVPEWAHAVVADNGQEIHHALYAHLSRQWVADGSCQHVITMLANDRDALDASVWLGFGMLGADTVRNLEPVAEESSDVRIRRATVTDVDSLMRLSLALQTHLRSEPVFLVPSPLNRQALEGCLADPHNAVFLAERDNAAVACLRVHAGAEIWILEDPGTATIRTTFTTEAHRGKGVCTALLNHALAWARDAGRVRCAVGFESANAFACRFWLRHFRPVCYSLIRNVDERLIDRCTEHARQQPVENKQ